jgi:hypothetical protein
MLRSTRSGTGKGKAESGNDWKALAAERNTAAMRALQREKQAALNAMREHLVTELHADQMIRRARRRPRASLE